MEDAWKSMDAAWVYQVWALSSERPPYSGGRPAAQRPAMMPWAQVAKELNVYALCELLAHFEQHLRWHAHGHPPAIQPPGVCVRARAV